MSDLISIGGQAVQVYQRALATVSNNIANMATEGYSRQEAVIVDNGPRQSGVMFFGTGSRIDTVQRQYDSFVESGLRSSISDVETQGPLVEYTDRVVDIMGSQKTGLSTSLDTFFASARALSTDPASIELRTQFLSEAEGLSARFRFLNGQFATLESETAEAVRVEVASINTLALELATVNRQLDRKSIVSQQAPALLDHRDQLLRDLAKLARIRVTESDNGSVDVSLGASANEGRIVAGRDARLLEASFDEQTLGVKLIVDPTGSRETVSGVNSGVLGGLISFRDQILAPAVSQLDYLAQTMVTHFNSAHEVGMDAGGKLGRDLFTIDPVFELQSPTSKTPIAVQWEVVDPTATQFHDIELTFDPNTKLWTAKDLISGEQARGEETMSLNGMIIRLDGNPTGPELRVLEATSRPAAGIRRLIDDPRDVAAASPVRVIENPSNPSGADAVIAWQPDQRDSLALRSVANFPPSSAWQTEGISIENTASRPASLIGQIPAGFSEVSLQLRSAIELPMDIQILTRDGRHIAGRSLTDLERDALIDPSAGFDPGATYSDAYLNGAGDSGYLGLDIFYGARAQPRELDIRNFEGRVTGTEILPALLQSRAIPDQVIAGGAVLIDAGALTLNGHALGELVTTATSTSLQASDVAAWLSAEVARLDLGAEVKVSAINEFRIPPSQLSLDKDLTINGIPLLPASSGTPQDLAALAELINDAQGFTNVQAYVGVDGELVLSNASGHEGEDIRIGPDNGEFDGASKSALGEFSGRHSGQLRIEAVGSAADVHLGIGAQGSPSDLAKLGFSTGVWIDGQVPEDLIVLTTGEGSGPLSAEFVEGAPAALPFLRDRTLELTFISDTRWQLLDTDTNTVVAERDYDPVNGVHYRGLHIGLSRPPVQGDRFIIDGNQDGVGDNANIIRLAGLEKSRDMIPGGRTLPEAWLDRLNAIGNLGNQAKIAQAALTVVNQQAVEARDRVSGVSLDEEAADLIRFQQAYQASAKVIQMANTLFDAISAIR